MKQSIRQDSRDVERAIARAQREAPRVAERILRRELLRGTRLITRRYRSLSAPGPGGTAVRSGRYRASYQLPEIRREGRDVVGKIGLFNLGLLPTYFEVWEGQLPDKAGRPVGGALEAVRPELTQRIGDALDRELADVTEAR